MDQKIKKLLIEIGLLEEEETENRYMNLSMEVGNACRIAENFRSLRLYIRRK